MQSPQQLFQAIQEQVSQIFPDATKVAQDEISAHMKALISSVIGKLDLVSREEFDAQQAVLERTRAKLEQLEKEFADLEQRFGSNSGLFFRAGRHFRPACFPSAPGWGAQFSAHTRKGMSCPYPSSIPAPRSAFRPRASALKPI